MLLAGWPLFALGAAVILDRRPGAAVGRVLALVALSPALDGLLAVVRSDGHPTSARPGRRGDRPGRCARRAARRTGAVGHPPADPPRRRLRDPGGRVRRGGAGPGTSAVRRVGAGGPGTRWPGRAAASRRTTRREDRTAPAGAARGDVRSRRPGRGPGVTAGPPGRGRLRHVLDVGPDGGAGDPAQSGRGAPAAGRRSARPARRARSGRRRGARVGAGVGRVGRGGAGLAVDLRGVHRCGDPRAGGAGRGVGAPLGADPPLRQRRDLPLGRRGDHRRPQRAHRPPRPARQGRADGGHGQRHATTRGSCSGTTSPTYRPAGWRTSSWSAATGSARCWSTPVVPRGWSRGSRGWSPSCCRRSAW